jgi:hypothetical protein
MTNFSCKKMDLSLRSDERHEAVVWRDFKVGAHARTAKLVERLDGRHNGHNFARVHVIVVEVLVTRAQDDLIASQLGEVSRQNRKLVEEYCLNFGVLLAIDLEIEIG